MYQKRAVLNDSSSTPLLLALQLTALFHVPSVPAGGWGGRGGEESTHQTR